MLVQHMYTPPAIASKPTFCIWLKQCCILLPSTFIAAACNVCMRPSTACQLALLDALSGVQNLSTLLTETNLQAAAFFLTYACNAMQSLHLWAVTHVGLQVLPLLARVSPVALILSANMAAQQTCDSCSVVACSSSAWPMCLQTSTEW